MRSAGPSMWKPEPQAPTPPTGSRAAAFQALLALNAKDRGMVLCWFCSRCSAFIGPGESVHDPGGPDWPRCAG